jgi:hypothetical protein
MKKEPEVMGDFPISINERSVMRYLGYPTGRQVADRRHVQRSIETVRGFLRSSSELVNPAAVYALFDSVPVDSALSLPEEGVELRSSFLAGRFSQSGTIGLFVATIGSAIEEQIGRYLGEGKRYEAMILDAIGSASAEAAAWSVHRHIQHLSGRRLVRYSPGYDRGVKAVCWPIEDQAVIFRLLSPERIGVRLSPAFMMMPRKSVSAVIGCPAAPGGRLGDDS